jgi:hypothetical protein
MDMNLDQLMDGAPLETNRTVEVRDGATITIRPLTKNEWRKLRRRVRKVRGGEDAREDAAEGAIHRQLASAVVGWNNMTREVIGKLAPVDITKLPEGPIPFSKENVLALLWRSTEFFTLVNRETEDFAAFIEDQEGDPAKN